MWVRACILPLLVRSTAAGKLYAVTVDAVISSVEEVAENWPRQELTTMLPIVGIGLMFAYSGYRRIGMGIAYCAAQVGFSLYMKVVLSDTEVASSASGKLRGIPAAFLITAIQQLVAVLVLGGAVTCILPCVQGSYKPKKISTSREMVAVLCFSLAFAANIGLNNFSLAFVSVSTNMMIRSCLPLATLICQLLNGHKLKENSLLEVGLMIVGILFAGIATFAQEGNAILHDGKNHSGFGIIVCLLSVVACALNLVLAELLGSMKLNPLDSMMYMAIPVALVMVLPTLLWRHPVNWPGYQDMTDVQIFSVVLHTKPAATCLIVLSGVFAAGYNLLTYTLVQSVSPAFTAFAGNFNKTIIIALSFVSRLEQLPRGIWGVIFVLAVAGNLVTFAWYSAVEQQSRSGKEAADQALVDPFKQSTKFYSGSRNA